MVRVDPLAGDDWDAQVTTHKDQSVFHSSAWARVLAESYGHQPFYLRFSVADHEVALVPLMEVSSPLTGCRGVSLPFSDFAGPLWIDPSQQTAIYRALIGLGRGRNWNHLEIRNDTHPPGNASPHRVYQSHQLDLQPGIEAIEAGFSPALRRAIRKAERSGAEVTVERSAGAMQCFYRLHCLTRRRHGLPPQPFRFFENILRSLIETGGGEILLARFRGNPVAAAIFLFSGHQAVYKFGASDTTHWHLRPNQLVMWTAIRRLVASGCRLLHFGRTSENDEGLARFKLSWGCRAEPLRYFRHNFHSKSWLPAGRSVAEGHPWVFGHLPLALNRFAGRMIYPHLD
jgi:lipid II:glycine glycyltransferase (peptidoglycan interpeptide bridge formation enzyme)